MPRLCPCMNASQWSIFPSAPTRKPPTPQSDIHILPILLRRLNCLSRLLNLLQHLPKPDRIRVHIHLLCLEIDVVGV